MVAHAIEQLYLAAVGAVVRGAVVALHAAQLAQRAGRTRRRCHHSSTGRARASGLGSGAQTVDHKEVLG